MSNGDLFSLRYHCVGPIDRLAPARTRGSARSSFFRRLTLAVAIEGYPMCRSVLVDDPSQPEKRRKALALLVDIKAAKSLKLAKPGSAVLPSEPAVKNCPSTSSGISL